MFLIIAALVLVAMFIRYFHDAAESGLPEPSGKIPFLGHAMLLGRYPAVTFLKWKKQCGPVYQISILGIKIIVLNSKKSITEWFTRPEFSGRSNLRLFKLSGQKFGPGFAVTEGPDVEEIRSFLLKAIHEHGGKKKLESFWQQDIKQVLDTWEKKGGSFIDLSTCFGEAVINGAWRIIGSSRLSCEDAAANVRHVDKMLEMDSAVSKLSYVIPEVTQLFSNTVAEKLEAYKCLMNTAQLEIDLHKTKRNHGNRDDVIDSLLEKEESTVDPYSAFHPSKKALAPILRDFMSGVVHTLSNTLVYCILYLSLNPSIAEELMAEIDSVIGHDRQPELSDREKMPFTQACLIETLRLSSVAPLAIPHCATKDVTFNGIRVSRGTLIVSNLYAVHHDPELWDDPEKFDPYRFLKADNALKENAWTSIIPFGIGRRACIGRFIAVDEFFMIVASLYQRFHVNVDNLNLAEEALHPNFGIVNTPQPGVSLTVRVRNAQP